MRKHYFLGHYNVRYQLTLSNLVIESVDTDLPRHPDRRELNFTASGKLRLKFEENLFRATSTASVQDLKGSLIFEVLHDAHGIGARHHVAIRRLKLDFNDVNPILDDLTSDRIKRALEELLNREEETQGCCGTLAGLGSHGHGH